jgi:hypothetical protein
LTARRRAVQQTAAARSPAPARERRDTSPDVSTEEAQLNEEPATRGAGDAPSVAEQLRRVQRPARARA